MSLAAAADMAKKASKKSPRDDWDRKPLALQVRGSVEWKAWLERAAEFSRMTVANFVDHAAAKAARDAGFDEPPPKR
jgi:uncharacterized protein (DUF1778 family)